MKLKKNKFIIGLSTTVLGSALAAGSQVAYADEPVDISSSQPTGVNEISEPSEANFAEVRDGSDLGGDQKSVETPSENDPQTESVDEANSDTPAESTEGAEQNSNDAVPANKTEENSTNVTEEDSIVKEEAGAESSSDSEPTNPTEETVLTEPTNITEDPEAEETEEPAVEAVDQEDTAIDTDAPATETDENLDTEVETGAAIEDGADTASTETDTVADTGEVASTEKAPASEENTEDITNKQTADLANTELKDDAKTSADSPQETPAGDEPEKDPDAGDAPLDEDGVPKTEEGNELAETAEGAELPTDEDTEDITNKETANAANTELKDDAKTSADSPQETPAGDQPQKDPEAGDAPLIEEGAELPLVEEGAEIAPGESVKDSEKKIKEADAYNLNSQVPAGYEKVNDAISYRKIKANVVESDPGYFEMAIRVDTTHRALDDVSFSDSFNANSSVLDLGSIKFKGEGNELVGSNDVVNFVPTSGLSSEPIGRSQVNINYYMSPEDLKEINDKKGVYILAISGRYKTPPSKEDSSQFGGTNSSVTGHLIPYPNENMNGKIIRVDTGSVNGNDKLRAIPVTENSENHGIENGVYNTGITIDNLYGYDEDGNLEDNSNRITGRVYTRDGKELDDVRVFYDGTSVKLKLPEGAVKDNSSIFNVDSEDGGLKDYRDLEVELFIRPRTDEEIKDAYVGYAEDFPTPTGTKKITNLVANENGTDTTTKTVIVNTYGDRVRYNNFNTLGRFEISLDDQSNYDVTYWQDGKDNTDKVNKLTAGKTTTIEERYNAYDSDLKSDLDAALEEKIAERNLDTSDLTEVGKNSYVTEDGWQVDVDEEAKTIKVTPPLNAEIGDSIYLPVDFKFTNGSVKDFQLIFRVNKEVIETPKYETKEDEPNTEITSTPSYDDDEDTVAPDRIELSSRFNVDDHGNLWDVKIDKTTGEITATTPYEVHGEYTLRVPITAYYKDPVLKDENGNPVEYKRTTYAEFKTQATKPYERKYTEKEPISYPVTIQQDPTMENGKQEIVQQGKDGVKEVTYNQKYNNDGTKDGAPTLVEEKVLTEATTHIIKVGTKTENTKVITETIPYDYKVVYDENLEAEKYVIEPGTNGTKSTTWNIVNSEVVGEPKVEITDPVQGVIRVGSKDFTGNVSHKDKEEIPFKVITKENPDLAVGTTRVTTPGQVGTKEVTYTVPVRNGALDSQDGKQITSTETVTKEAVDEVVEIGTKSIEETVEIPFNTEYKYDDTLKAGEIVEVTAGQNGTNKVVTSYDPATQSAKMTEEVVTDPTNRVVRVGGKTNGSQTVTEKVPFTVEVRENTSLNKGEYKIIQEGVAGEVEKILTIENSKVTNTAEGRTITAVKNQIIEVGSADFTGEVTHEVTEEVPFTVRIVEDSTMAPGTHKVVTEGQAGLKTTRYTQAIKNGAADGELKSEEIVTDTTKAPVEEVIHVGTARVNSENTSTSGDIPVDITYTYDPTKERGTAEKGAFTPGRVETKIVNQYNPETGEIETTTQETVTNARQEIIVGTKDYTGTFTHEERKVTPFETQIVHDPTLKAGETRVDQTGVNGVETRTITQKFTNGDVAEKSYSDWTTESTVQNEIIRVGSLTEGTKKHEEAIPFDYKVEYDPTIPAGEYKITQEGKDGKRTTEWTIKNSQVVGDPKVTEEAPVNAIIKVGNKDFTGVATHTEEFTIPYKVEIRENNQLPVGTRNTIQEGVDGSYKVTYSQNIENGKTVGELSKTESDRVEAKDQIIEIGTKPVDPVEKDVSAEVGVNVEIVNDPELELGKTRTGELVPGKVENVVTTDYDPATGELTTRENKVVTPAKQIIYVGTKDLVGTQEFVVTQPVPFETEYRQDPNLEAGKTEIEQQGQNGQKTVTYKAEAKNGTVTSHKATEEITKEPVKQIIRVGTKEKIVDTKTVTTVTNIPYETIVEFDPELPVGEKKVVTKGQFGEETTTITATNNNGTIRTTSNKETTKQPVNEVIKVGTKTPDTSTEVVNVETKAIPFETEVIFDNTMELGTSKEENPGKEGTLTITFTTPVTNGVAGETVRTEERTEEPVNRVVRVGTKTTQTTSNTVEVEVPFETEIITDNTLAAGEKVIDQVGKNGKKTVTVKNTIENGVVKTDVVENTVVEPTKQIVRVGTKCPDKPSVTNGEITEKSVIEIPFTTRIVEDPSLDAGQIVEDQKGVVGKKTVTVTIPITNGVAGDAKVDVKETIAPVERVVRVGTKKPTVKPETPVVENKEIVSVKKVPVQFETEIIYDNTISVGKVIEEQKGVMGERTVTSTVLITNGVAGQPQISSKITKEPVKQIIRIGTKKTTNSDNNTKPSKPTPPVSPTTQTITREIPYDTVFIYDNTIEAGKKVVTSPGQKGEKIVTVTSRVVNGKIVTETTEKITKQPKTEYVRVGTKAPKYSGDDVVTKESKVLIPFETEIIYDDTLPLGQTEVVSEGRDGIQVVTITTRYQNGLVVDTTTDGYVEREAINKIVRVGTKTDGQAPTIHENTGIIDIPTTTEDNDHIIVIPEGAIDDEDHVVIIPEEDESDEDDASRKKRPINDDQVVKGPKNIKVSEYDANAVNIKRSAVSSTNPKTGITGTAGIISTLGISLAGLTASRKKKENDEE